MNSMLLINVVLYCIFDSFPQLVNLFLCLATINKPKIDQFFYTLLVTDVDAAPRASQSTTKPQAARKPSPAVGKYKYYYVFPPFGHVHVAI